MLDVEDIGALTREDEHGLTSQQSWHGFRLPASGLDLHDLEVELVIQALERTGGNQTRAAALLGLNRDQIRYRMAKFGLKPLRLGKDHTTSHEFELTQSVRPSPRLHRRDICENPPRLANEQIAQG